jgi:hypothetical protein
MGAVLPVSGFMQDLLASQFPLETDTTGTAGATGFLLKSTKREMYSAGIKRIAAMARSQRLE